MLLLLYCGGRLYLWSHVHAVIDCDVERIRPCQRHRGLLFLDQQGAGLVVQVRLLGRQALALELKHRIVLLWLLLQLLIGYGDSVGVRCS